MNSVKWCAITDAPHLSWLEEELAAPYICSARYCFSPM
jgi:hypothetical protein